jgi:IS1 family transposase
MANIMSVERRNTILRLLCEGNSVRSVTRLMGTNIRSVLARLNWAGDHCRRLMDERCRGLRLQHLECDEIWTYCGKKQGRLTIEERAERSDIGDIYLWTAVDQPTRLIPAYAVGKRSADMARRFMFKLAGTLAMPNAHASDSHSYTARRYDPVVQISTDGFAGYREAVDMAFGPYAEYGQIIKDYRNKQLPGNYAPAEMVGTQRKPIRGDVEPSSICTSHVERNNLTIRHFIKRFARLTICFSRKLANLEDAIAMYAAYYNFCWRPGEMRITPAMAAGITNRLWSFDDLMNGGR